MSEKKCAPSMDEWLREAKKDKDFRECGMYLFHNGVVRSTAKAKVRMGEEDTQPVTGMDFAYDRDKVEKAVEEARSLPGIHYVRAWLNEGHLEVGDDIMLILIGGDIRPRVIDALQTLVGNIKNHCVKETETYKETEQ